MFKGSLNLVKSLGKTNLWFTPNFKYMSIQQPIPMINPAFIRKDLDVSINQDQDIINKIMNIQQELVIEQPIMECKHKPKARARMKRIRRKKGLHLSVRWK